MMVLSIRYYCSQALLLAFPNLHIARKYSPEPKDESERIDKLAMDIGWHVVDNVRRLCKQKAREAGIRFSVRQITIRYGQFGSGWSLWVALYRPWDVHCLETVSFGLGDEEFLGSETPGNFSLCYTDPTKTTRKGFPVDSELIVKPDDQAQNLITDKVVEVIVARAKHLLG